MNIALLQALGGLGGGGGFNPINLTPFLWYSSDSIINENGYAATLVDKSGNNRNVTQSDVTRRFQLVSDNGNLALKSDGANDFYQTENFAINTLFTSFIIFKHDLYALDKGIFGGSASNLGLYVDSGNYKVFQGGTPVNLEAYSLNEMRFFINEWNTTDSYYLSDKADNILNVGGTLWPGGFFIGKYASSDSRYFNGKYYDFLIFNRSLTIDEKINLIDFFKKKYSAPWGKFGKIEANDGVFLNSIELEDKTTYKIRNPFSRKKLTTNADRLIITAISTLASQTTYKKWAGINVNVDGTNNLLLFTTSQKNRILKLPVGEKNLEITEGLTSKPTTEILGTYINNIKLDSSFSEIQENITEKIVFLVDSIGVGANSTNPAAQSFTTLFRTAIDTSVLGYGFARLANFAANSTLINDTVAKIQALLSNATTKKLYIELGTNDYGLDTLAAVTFLTYYADLIDAVHAADSTIHVYCQSPFTRGSEASLMADYRTGIQALCTTRTGWTTYIHGPSVVAFNLTNFDADNVHLTTVGHQVAHDYQDDIIL
jgi:hypothetical protein